jgi:hypothetical protein
MMQMVTNTFVLAAVCALWFLLGIGPALVLLRPSQRSQAFLLAPLLGMSLLGIVGLYEISVLLVPLTPWLDIALLGAGSLALCYLTRRQWPAIWGRFRKRLIWLVVAPAGYLLFHAALYAPGGYQLLIGSSDQLQYAACARHMLAHVHTGSVEDVPVPRQDHFIYDNMTRALCYLKGYRRADVVTLAVVSAVTGMEPDEAFPVTFGAGCVVLGLALGLVGRSGLRLHRAACVALQTALLGSGFLLVCQFQGSLACLLALPQRLTCLVAVAWLLRSPSLRAGVVVALLFAAHLGFYADTAVPGLLLPAGVIAAWHIVRSRRWALLRPLAATAVLAAVLAPYGVYTAAVSTYGNCLVLVGGLQTSSAGAVVSPGGPFVQSPYWAQIWNFLLGVCSYYDPSAVNATLAQSLANHSWSGCAAFLLLSALALIGFVRGRAPAAALFALGLLGWTAATLLSVRAGDYLRYARSAQYAFPLVVPGLVALCFCRRGGSSSARSASDHLCRWAGGTALASLVGFNVWSDYRTFSHVVSHDTVTDRILLRLDEHDPVWASLRQELTPSREAPVLMSGFLDTVRPFTLACALREFPHFLGDSVSRFWPLYGERNFKPGEFNSRRSNEELLAVYRSEDRPWAELVPQFLVRSRQAVVPLRHGYPAEWGAWPDVVAPRVRRFPNLCDVAYRSELAVTWEGECLGPLSRDKHGAYRMLAASGPIVPVSQEAEQYVFRLTYDGAVGDVEFRAGERVQEGSDAPGTGSVSLVVTVEKEEASHLSFIVHRPVKIRALAWDPEE